MAKEKAAEAVAPQNIIEGSKMFTNHRIILGIAFTQASRDHMQDSLSVRLNCCHKKQDDPSTEVDYFGVYDGHGVNGENISRFVAYNLYTAVLGQYTKSTHGDFPRALEEGFIVVDDFMRKLPELQGEHDRVFGGCTSCTVWLKGNHIFCANVGDSRFIVSYNGKAVRITTDHKPNSPWESVRIFNAGGQIKNNRVNGIIATSRTFGDFRFKDKIEKGPHEQLVTVVPDVYMIEMDEDIDFMVVATDGVWDIMNNQQVVDYVFEQMSLQAPLSDICRDLLESCKVPIDPVTKCGSDNMALVIGILR